MDKNEKAKKIIADLIDLDPSLEKHQAELEKIIHKFVVAKPDVPFDDNFKNQLKKELLEKIEAEKLRKHSIWSVMSAGKKMAISASFIAVLAIVLGMAFLAAPQTTKNRFSFSEKDSAPETTEKQQVAQREEAAFGQLKSNSVPPEQRTKEGLGAGDTGRLGAGGAATAATVPLTDSSVQAENEMAVLPPYVPKRFVFTYEGENIRINQNKSEVLRRIKDLDLDDFGDLIASFNGSLVDLGSFSDTKLQSFSIAEDKPYGLFVNLSAEDGSISIGQNWKQWNKDCRNDACPQRQALTAEDIPADQMLISIADEFLQRHGINMENFEQGYVDQQWNRYLPENSANSTQYVPEELSVIYPLKIGERKIYNQSGTREGLRVQVNIRLMRASGMYGLTTQKYESSLYETETDFLRLVQIAENGGSVYPMPLAEPADGSGMSPEGYREQIVQLELETPSYVYLKYWQYDGRDTQELVVPALAFPVQNAKQSGYYQDNIIVPLIKDLLEQ